MVEENQTVVIDNGSDTIKAGFSGEKSPRVIFPSIISRSKTAGAFARRETNVEYIGDKTSQNRVIYNISSPIEHGIVMDWDDMEKIWHHTFYN